MIWVMVFTAFVGIAATLALVLCGIFGSLSQGIAIVSLVAGGGCALGVWFKFKNYFPRLEKFGPLEWTTVFFYLVFCFRHFFWLVFQDGNSVKALITGNYGDLPHHIAYINYLSRGAQFWPKDPLLTGEQFSYPFGIDLFSALLTKLGVHYLYYLPLMGFIIAVILMLALLQWGRGFALGAYLFSGGGLNYLFFATGELKNYQDGKPWGSVILLFLTQRGFLYAIPAGLLLLWSWRRRFFTQEAPLPRWIEGLIWGTMPFFHVHTFLFLSFVFAIWWCWKRTTKDLWILGVALLPGTLEMFLLTNHFTMASVLKWNPGWMIGHDSVPLFFWNNYGLYVPLTLFTLYQSFVNKQHLDRFIFLTPAWVLYLACLFINFAPWDWDNIKLMMWCYLLALPMMWDLALRELTPWGRRVAIVLLFAPGFVALASLHSPVFRGFEIYTRQDVDGVCKIVRRLDPSHRFASAQIHNHPALLCGQPLVAGYEGVLWSHGSTYIDTQNKLKKLMLGDPQWRQLAQDLKARYLFWGKAEESQYAGSSRPWESSGIRVLGEGEWGKIYDLSELYGSTQN